MEENLVELLALTNNHNLEDESTLYSLSSEYLKAAVFLHDSKNGYTSYTSVIYYLLGHSAELSLKAFLYKREVAVSSLKRIGHDLKKLVTISLDNGFPKTVKLDSVIELSEIYKNKNLEYRVKKSNTYPNTQLLINEVNNLQSVVFDKIIQWSD